MRFAGTALIALLVAAAHAEQSRAPGSDPDLRFWLENMVWHHGYGRGEIESATGLAADEVQSALERFGIRPETKPPRAEGAPLLVLPYPGGRHPRVGFLDGAVDPQRETKLSAFAPWDASSYAVVDLPEAIWSNLGLTYLAHTHIDTIWSARGVELEALEWDRGPGRTLRFERALPNGIRFGAWASPLGASGLSMELWLHNGTGEALTDLRAQTCVMLKAMAGFAAQTADNKVLRAPYAACRDESGRRWVITAWEPVHRAWQNPPVPCLHSDPEFPDCPPAGTVRAHGRLWFWEGEDIEAELGRLDATGWREAQVPDIREAEPDLTAPPMVDGEPAPGRRVRAVLPSHAGTGVYHALYLPSDWTPGGNHPVLVEFAGNGPYRGPHGEISSGRPEGSALGYGLSAGRGCVWLCLPYLNAAGDANVTQWWGDPPGHDPAPTVAYAKAAVRAVCGRYGGDPDRVVLCGFSRGAIACNFIGLHDDEIAGLWCGFAAFSHYDGVRDWGYPGAGRGPAVERLRRLGGRPQLIMGEGRREGGNLSATARYLDGIPGAGPRSLTFLPTGFRNHDDAWILRPGAAREAARAWLAETLAPAPAQPPLH